MDATILILLLVGAVVIFGMLGYRTQNRLAPLRERIDETSSNIKTCVQKRNRLLKQLLDIAASYAKHEKELHERISADFNATPQMARESFAYVSHLVSTFPELRADRTYMSLMQDLSGLESELQQKFEEHNARVRDYNSVRLSFPHDIFAFWGGFQVAQYLDSAEYMKPDAESPKRQPTVFPRLGMLFRDTKDGSLAKITQIDEGWVKYVFIPSRGGNPDGATDKQHWIQQVADGLYQIE